MAIPWLCLVILPVASQVVHQWTSQRGGEKEDKARALQVDANGSAWVAGYTESSLDGHTNAGGRDIFLMKFDAQGVHQWTRQRGGERDDFAYGLQVDDVGNALVAGSTLSSLDGHTNAGESDIFLMKFDAQGVHLWTRQRGGAGSDWATALQVDANGSAWVAGFTDSSLDGHTNAGDADVFLMKFDAQGLHQWTRQRGDQWDDKAKSLQVDAKGNAWVAGETKLEEFAFFAGARPQLDVFLMKFDAQGVHQWTRVRWGYGDDKARALQVDAEGDAWVAGYTDSSRLDGHDNAGGRDVFLMKFNAQGVHQWTRVHGGKGSDMAQALQVDDVGNAWVAGCTWTSFLDGEPRAYDLFLMKFDVQGVHQWTSQRGGQGWDEAQALQDKLLGGAGLGLAPGCTGHDLSKCSCSDLKALISAPHCPVDQSACLTAGNCPAGCPNLAAQVVTWLASVNAKAKNVKFSTLSFDGEDGGESATAWALCQFKLLGDELGIPEVGMAKSIAAGPQSPGVTYTMPETYWYMGELWPCTGDQWQLKEKPPVCTTQSSYRSFVDKAWPFLNWLNISDKVMQEKPGFPSLIDNIRWVKTNAPGKAVIPMFSFEGLSLKSCFATHFSAGVKNVSDICGTFDGFSFWQWETFKEFMIYFADAFQVDEVGIYDLQFIPPYWFDNKAFGPNDDCKASAR